MTCLIIGDGPSKVLIKKDDILIDVFGVHYNNRKECKAVLSLDITQFHKKEELMINKGIKVILGDNSCYGEFKERLKKTGVEFFSPQKMLGNSGAFAIEWAVSQGYKKIYTAGIDFFCDEGEYILPSLLQHINKYILELQNNGIKIYKYSSASKLNCPVKYLD